MMINSEECGGQMKIKADQVDDNVLYVYLWIDADNHNNNTTNHGLLHYTGLCFNSSD